MVPKVRPIKSPRLNSKTTATGVKKFLVHCDFVMDSTEREIVWYYTYGIAKYLELFSTKFFWTEMIFVTKKSLKTVPPHK